MSAENSNLEVAAKNLAATAPKPQKAKSSGSRARARKAPAVKRALRKKKVTPRKVAKTTALAKVAPPRVAYQSEERRQVNALMLRQRDNGMSVAALARAHKTSRNSIYQRLWRARQDSRVLSKNSGPVSQVPETVKGAEISYLRGRVDQLEALFAKFINLGMEKILRAAST